MSGAAKTFSRTAGGEESGDKESFSETKESPRNLCAEGAGEGFIGSVKPLAELGVDVENESDVVVAENEEETLPRCPDLPCEDCFF